MESFAHAARERDLRRYLTPWLKSQNLVMASDSSTQRLVYKGYKPQNSRDRALTAFAKLATLRLNAKRAMVSLIDSRHQYILAEATQTLSLVAGNVEILDDEVWLGTTVISRIEAVCHYTINSTYTALEENGDPYTADCLVISDCRNDPRLADKDYVTSEPGVRFYAGVPITSKAGYPIGVYAISDEKPRDCLSASEVRFMQDVAAAVMEHLELAKDSDDRSKGELMVRGLAEFIERSSMHEPGHVKTGQSSIMERQTENSRLDPDEELGAATTSNGKSKAMARKREPEPKTAGSRIFHRAARIMRQSTDADGVVFFDATSITSIKGTIRVPTPPISSNESPDSSPSDARTTDSAASSRSHQTRHTRRHAGSGRENPPQPARATTYGTSDGTAAAPGTKVEINVCPVVGLSLNKDVAGAAPEEELAFTRSAMERYIQRYPNGKFFSFDDEGVGISPSDEKSDKSEPERSECSSTPRPRKRRDRFTPIEFLKVLPNVRTLIFLPLWDAASERWAAGAFIWTTATGKLMSPDNELPYLKAFGNSILAEIARENALRADRAKTTFIASISHELRSPLHGILGSVEFLRDAVSSPHSKLLVSSIETCGRTLLDTIDHVLDYAKINKLGNTNNRRRRTVATNRASLSNHSSVLGVTSDFNLAQLVEEVCDTVCAGRVFRRSHGMDTFSLPSATNVPPEGKAGPTDANIDTENHERASRDEVVVTIDVDSSANWMIHSQSGALRRIVMNLLGNALKYTEAGNIAVSLTQQAIDDRFIDFNLIFADTGKGISPEYQRMGLFAPFSQEDPFSDGTGLGLSIVKQIVDSFKGGIGIDSTLNVGTKATVSLRLPRSHSNGISSQDSLWSAAVETLGGKCAGVVLSPTSFGGGGQVLKQSLQECHRNLGMNTSDKLDLTDLDTPNFVFTDALSLASILEEHKGVSRSLPARAIICICCEPSKEAAIKNRFYKQVFSLGWTLEVVSFPLGPRKLATLLLNIADRDARSILNEPLVPVEKSPIIDASSQLDNKHIPAHLPSSTITSSSDSFPLEIRAVPTLPRQPRVLLVDDNAINLRLLVAFAKRKGLEYKEATNGLEAFDQFKAAVSSSPEEPKSGFDYVFMDLSMPVMDGLESTRRIRQFESQKSLQRTTVVALTGLASAEDQQEAKDAGVDLYLVKPVRFTDIAQLFDPK